LPPPPEPEPAWAPRHVRAGSICFYPVAPTPHGGTAASFKSDMNVRQ